MGKKTWSEVLEEAGQDGEAGERVDNPYGRSNTQARRDQFHETAAELISLFKSAGKLPSSGDGGGFSRAASEKALNSARAVANDVDSPEELERIAKDVHRGLGASLTDNQSAAVDALRNAEYEARTGKSADVFDGAVIESLDSRVRTNPMPTPFEQERIKAVDRANNKRMRAKGAGNEEQAARLRQRVRALESAENEDELRRAQGRLPEQEAQQMLDNARERAKEAAKNEIGGIRVGN